MEGGEQSTHQGVGRRLLLKVKRAQGRNVRIFLKRPHYAKGKERRERFETEMAEDDDERRDGQPRRKKRIWEVAREGGGEGGSLQREGDVVSSRPVDEMATAHPSPTVRVFPRFGCRFFRRIFSLLLKERRFPPPPPSSSFGSRFGPAVEKDCLALGPQSPKPYRLSWCCVLPRGSVPRFPPARVYLVAPLPAPQAFPLFRCLSSSDRSSTEPPSNFSQFKIQSQISNNFFSSLAPSPGKEGGSA